MDAFSQCCVGETFQQCLAPPFTHPRREAGVKAVRCPVPRIHVGGYVHACRACVFELFQDFRHPAEIRPIGGFQMPDLGADFRLVRDAENLIDRDIDSAGLRSLVGEIGAAIARGNL